MATTYRAKVARGAKLLDEVHGRNWVREIRLGDIEMGSCDRCIVGQLYGHYATGCEKLGIADLRDSYDLGFDVPEAVDDEEAERRYELLAQRWRELIRKRRYGGEDG